MCYTSVSSTAISHYKVQTWLKYSSIYSPPGLSTCMKIRCSDMSSTEKNWKMKKKTHTKKSYSNNKLLSQQTKQSIKQWIYHLSQMGVFFLMNLVNYIHSVSKSKSCSISPTSLVKCSDWLFGTPLHTHFLTLAPSTEITTFDLQRASKQEEQMVKQCTCAIKLHNYLAAISLQ